MVGSFRHLFCVSNLLLLKQCTSLILLLEDIVSTALNLKRRTWVISDASKITSFRGCKMAIGPNIVPKNTKQTKGNKI